MKIGDRVRKNKKLPIQAILAVLLIAAIATAAPSIGRFVPTHKIVQPVYCGSCHPEQVQELAATTHLPKFAARVYTAANNSGVQIDFREATSAGCMMCHNSWDNRKWFGVTNYTVTEIENVTWTNTLLDSHFIITNLTSGVILKDHETEFLPDVHTQKEWRISFVNVTPWYNASYEDYWVDSSGKTYTRWDKVWENVSGYSPGPVSFTGCGYNAEHGMCHIAVEGVNLSIQGKKADILPKPSRANEGVFFAHEMAYTTAQYSAKSVKLCAVCHVLKLPPMNRTGMPIGELHQLDLEYHNTSYSLEYREPTDWAHQQVPCIRCHAHAGIGAGEE